MFNGLDESKIEAAIEALLFVSDEPVNTITLADMLEIDPQKVAQALERLQGNRAQEGSGIIVREVAGGWRLYTNPDFHELIEKYVISWDTRKLSNAALETLAIIAYTQPITRARIASIRGVSSDSSIASLIEKGLVREAGTDDSPGNPILYVTSQSFLEQFGLRSVKDLPKLETFAPDEQTRTFIRERLGAASLAVDSEQTITKEMHTDEFLPKGLLGQTDKNDGDAMPQIPDVLRQSMVGALSQSFGAVEKINFRELHFDDDE